MYPLSKSDRLRFLSLSIDIGIVSYSIVVRYPTRICLPRVCVFFSFRAETATTYQVCRMPGTIYKRLRARQRVHDDAQENEQHPGLNSQADFVQNTRRGGGTHGTQTEMANGGVGKISSKILPIGACMHSRRCRHISFGIFVRGV